jgi:hypothetical protein
MYTYIYTYTYAVRGRDIGATKVTALPESLGQCKLLEKLCVPRPPPPPCAIAAVPALRCCAWRCRRCAAARGAAALGAGAEPRGVGCTGARSGVGRSRPARPHGWRAGTRAAPSSRRCRRRPTGRTSRHCECRRRRAQAAPPMRRRGVGRVVSARAPDVHDWVHVCACICLYVAVHAHVCIRMRACADCVPACALRGRVRARWRRKGGPLSRYHKAHIYSYMYACAHVQMCACARRVHPSVRGRVYVRARRERASTGCHYVYVCLYVCVYVGACMYRLPFECARVRVRVRSGSGASAHSLHV